MADQEEEGFQSEPSKPKPKAPKRKFSEEDDADEDDEPKVRNSRRAKGDGGVSSLIPYKNGMALAAYYCGVFGLIPILGLLLGTLALIFGLVGLSHANKNPEAKGKGHAIAGIVLGALELLGHLGGCGFIFFLGMRGRR